MTMMMTRMIIIMVRMMVMRTKRFDRSKFGFRSNLPSCFAPVNTCYDDDDDDVDDDDIDGHKDDDGDDNEIINIL